jgi:2-dehydro-3-deoxyphosphogluconate aldolase/(4S)-4-hydroxy-2-oxoglutarate aldolase
MLSENKNLKFKELLSTNKIIPVAVFTDLDNALKTAEFLLSNSFKLLEITLRTKIAFQCISEIKKRFPEMIVGAGSVLSRDSLKKSINSGSVFGVAPGFDLDIVKTAIRKNIPFVPGVSTPTEMNSALKAGCEFIKVFPAANLCTPAYIKSISAPFRMKEFFIIPTGGINEDNIIDYLKTDRVIACGASYIVDSKLIEKGDFDELGRRIQRTKELLLSV